MSLNPHLLNILVSQLTVKVTHLMSQQITILKTGIHTASTLSLKDWITAGDMEAEPSPSTTLTVTAYIAFHTEFSIGLHLWGSSGKLRKVYFLRQIRQNLLYSSTTVRQGNNRQLLVVFLKVQGQFAVGIGSKLNRDVQDSNCKTNALWWWKAFVLHNAGVCPTSVQHFKKTQLLNLEPWH